MKGNSIVKKTLAQYKENELIIANKVYKEKLYGQISEAAYYKTLQRMCDAGELIKIAKGVYHLPKISNYGVIPLPEKEIVKAFTSNSTGAVVGYSMYNDLNLTTQIAKTITIMSSSIEGLTKSIRNVVIHKLPLKFSKEIISMVQGLDILQNFNVIQDINYSAFLKFTENLASTFDAKVFEEIIATKTYKKSTISFLQEILNYYGVENNLNKYLSTLSKYKHPRMEELYETARVSK